MLRYFIITLVQLVSLSVQVVLLISLALADALCGILYHLQTMPCHCGGIPNQQQVYAHIQL